MSEQPDDIIRPTPYGITVAALMRIENLCDSGEREWADIRVIAGEAVAEASQRNIEGAAAQIQGAPVSPGPRCPTCDANPAELKPATVIVVEVNGHPARRFTASGWEVLTSDLEAGDLVLTDDSGKYTAQVGARMWDTVYDEGAALDGDPYYRQGKKLAIALDALREIRDRYEDDERGPTGQGEASRALDAIAELDL